MPYVTGMVCAVPDANKQAYAEMSRAMAPIFRRHGALEVVDCWGVDVPDGEVTSFPMAVKCASGETVVFSWIAWPDAEAAEKGMKEAMADAEMTEHMGAMPFDGKRMIYGGFETL
ncbi:DUF1428 domain-containing protein [Sulfitobacter aestuarii]|uniref:DUF1428 domain-containing protein n=1 Tax=Sulfitobacter aestuarii TaxID=2161676 RepID=A0ABW5U5H8_9RHOB